MDRADHGSQALEVSVEELQRLQETDKHLAGMTECEGFFKQDGILYRHWVPTEEAAGGSSDKPDHPTEGLSETGATVGTNYPLRRSPWQEEDSGPDHEVILLAYPIQRRRGFLQELCKVPEVKPQKSTPCPHDPSTSYR